MRHSAALEELPQTHSAACIVRVTRLRGCLQLLGCLVPTAFGLQLSTPVPDDLPHLRRGIRTERLYPLVNLLGTGLCSWAVLDQPAPSRSKLAHSARVRARSALRARSACGTAPHSRNYHKCTARFASFMVRPGVAALSGFSLARSSRTICLICAGVYALNVFTHSSICSALDFVAGPFSTNLRRHGRS
jgi:hypothetical protein